MIALLPLVNLPFDWASIGMTRALLRRGCEDHGIWILRSPTPPRSQELEFQRANNAIDLVQSDQTTLPIIPIGSSWCSNVFG
jgi:hypothetical protein